MHKSMGINPKIKVKRMGVIKIIKRNITPPYYA